ncbi:hypothetical protein SNEBB_010115 [Seison nebaliae]|nr:hypothetical protein SNEBB_010115 [Seison nebaliae]
MRRNYNETTGQRKDGINVKLRLGPNGYIKHDSTAGRRRIKQIQHQKLKKVPEEKFVMPTVQIENDNYKKTTTFTKNVNKNNVGNKGNDFDHLPDRVVIADNREMRIKEPIIWENSDQRRIESSVRNEVSTRDYPSLPKPRDDSCIVHQDRSNDFNSNHNYVEREKKKPVEFYMGKNREDDYIRYHENDYDSYPKPHNNNRDHYYNNNRSYVNKQSERSNPPNQRHRSPVPPLKPPSDPRPYDVIYRRREYSPNYENERRIRITKSPKDPRDPRDPKKRRMDFHRHTPSPEYRSNPTKELDLDYLKRKPMSPDLTYDNRPYRKRSGSPLKKYGKERNDYYRDRRMDDNYRPNEMSRRDNRRDRRNYPEEEFNRNRQQGRHRSPIKDMHKMKKNVDNKFTDFLRRKSDWLEDEPENDKREKGDNYEKSLNRTRERSIARLIVRNLKETVTKRDIYDLMAPYGEIANCQMNEGADNRSAYVDFTKRRNAVDAAIKYHSRTLDEYEMQIEIKSINQTTNTIRDIKFAERRPNRRQMDIVPSSYKISRNADVVPMESGGVPTPLVRKNDLPESTAAVVSSNASAAAEKYYQRLTKDTKLNQTKNPHMQPYLGPMNSGTFINSVRNGIVGSEALYLHNPPPPIIAPHHLPQFPTSQY